MYDLDRLAEVCRDIPVRELMEEAVRCYTVGAYRATILTTWIAVVFDYYAKLRELDLLAEGGDGEVRSRLERFERARANADVQVSLAMERELLGDALKVFEFISPLQHEDLDRLRKDRHRCAHPAMRDADERYEPTAELARTHMRNAVEHLLSREPVQGKSALAHLHKMVGSAYFPTDIAGARRLLQNGPLKRPRAPLLRNFLHSVAKEALIKGHKTTKARRLCAAIQAAGELHPGLALDSLREAKWLSRLNRELVEENPRVWRLLALAPITQETLRAGELAMLEHQASNTDMEAWVIAFGIDIPAVSEGAIARLSTATSKSLKQAINSAEPRVCYCDRAVTLYLASRSFNEANKRAGDLVIPLADVFVDSHAERLVSGAKGNGEVSGSHEWTTVRDMLESRGFFSTTGVSEPSEQPTADGDEGPDDDWDSGAPPLLMTKRAKRASRASPGPPAP